MLLFTVTKYLEVNRIRYLSFDEVEGEINMIILKYSICRVRRPFRSSLTIISIDSHISFSSDRLVTGCMFICYIILEEDRKNILLVKKYQWSIRKYALSPHDVINMLNYLQKYFICDRLMYFKTLALNKFYSIWIWFHSYPSHTFSDARINETLFFSNKFYNYHVFIQKSFCLVIILSVEWIFFS